MTNIRRVFAGAAVALALVVAACESGPVAVRTGHLNLMLTDAPGDVAQAVVTIDQIYLQSGTDSTDPSGRIILRDADLTVDLLTLRDSLMIILDSAEIPVGTYRQLRLVVTGGYVAVVGEDTTTTDIYASSPDYEGLPDGAEVTGELQMPSFATSGLKVTLPNGVVVIGDDELVTLVIDFDVAQSFGRLAGGSDRWVMHPVIKADPPAAP